MHKPTLYLFVGYPGAGKTTIARLIEASTGATHIWADAERHKLFARPSHTQAESRQLYDRLNERTDTLLQTGQSVLFDTNFNYRQDRDLLRGIASRHQAKVVIVWLTTPRQLAKQRAVHAATVRNGYAVAMSATQFDAIADKLQPPAEDEKVIKIDGTNIDEAAVKQLLHL